VRCNLKFNIRDIGPDGLRVRRTIEEAKVRALLAEAGVETVPGVAAEGHLDVVLSREGDPHTVLARGTSEVRFGVTCSRCLGPATIVAEEPELKLTFLPPARTPPPAAASRQEEDEEEPAGELELEDLDTFSHDGECVDLEPVLRELLLLAIPMAPLCSEACKGLCPSCGVDRNQTSCACEAVAPTQSPWARALAGLKKS
jgi:uncharacterized protein